MEGARERPYRRPDGLNKNRDRPRQSPAEFTHHRRQQNVMMPHPPVEKKLRYRLGPVTQAAVGAGCIFVDFVYGHTDLSGIQEGEPEGDQQQVIVQRSEVQMAVSMPPEKGEQLAK